ncbi:hypothetical protein Hanom_Chr07g00638751 [Helianthus anomalus]
MALPHEGKAISFIKEEGRRYTFLSANVIDTFFTSLVNIHTVLQRFAGSEIV